MRNWPACVNASDKTKVSSYKAYNHNSTKAANELTCVSWLLSRIPWYDQDQISFADSWRQKTSVHWHSFNELRFQILHRLYFKLLCKTAHWILRPGISFNRSAIENRWREPSNVPTIYAQSESIDRTSAIHPTKRRKRVMGKWSARRDITNFQSRWLWLRTTIPWRIALAISVWVAVAGPLLAQSLITPNTQKVRVSARMRFSAWMSRILSQRKDLSQMYLVT